MSEAPTLGGADSKFQRTVQVINKRGLHARAAAKFVKTAGTFDASVRVSASKCMAVNDGSSVSGRSIMGLMMLAAGPGSELCIQVDGRQAAEALAALTALVENRFDEEE
jgi:phosphocarrier protein HPr